MVTFDVEVGVVRDCRGYKSRPTSIVEGPADDTVEIILGAVDDVVDTAATGTEVDDDDAAATERAEIDELVLGGADEELLESESIAKSDTSYEPPWIPKTSQDTLTPVSLLFLHVPIRRSNDLLGRIASDESLDPVEYQSRRYGG